VLLAIVLLLQGSPVSALRTGLDTLYGGDFERAAAYFAELAARDTSDPAPVVFEAGAYIWWAAALDSAEFELQRIDSLLGVALRRAQPGREFWRATALGYRARQREENGHSFSAAKDAKAMRDIYRLLLAADSSCADCYLGLGVYDYGLARAGALARVFARIIGLGSGDAERGIRYMRRVARDGDLARVEGTWVLAAALMREAARDSRGSAVLVDEARGYVEGLAARYPGNPVFQRFLQELPAKTSARKSIRAPARAAPAAIAPAPVGRRERRELAEHIVHVTLDRVGGNVEPLCDFLVAQSGRDQLFDLLLPLGETHGAARRRRIAPRSGSGIAGGARWRGRSRQVRATRDRANRFHDVVGGRVLHDEPVGAAVDELRDVLLRRHEVDHHGLGLGRRRLEGREEVVAVAVGERRIEQHDLRLRIAQQRRRGVRALGARHDLHVPVRAEQAREAVPHQTVVFHDEHANPGCAHGRRTRAPLGAAPIDRPIAFSSSIIDSAAALGRDPALHTANGPRHTPPPVLDVMYFPSRTSGSDRGDECIYATSLL
jgi:hypothetical protein